MNQLTTTSIVSLFETTKEQRQNFVKDIIFRMQVGEVNPLTLHTQIKCIEEVVKNILSDSEYKQSILIEAEKYGSKKFEFGNASFQTKEAGTKYEWETTGDSLLMELMNREANIKALIKERQEFLKKVPLGGVDVLYEDCLERVYPPSKSSETIVAITLK